MEIQSINQSINQSGHAFYLYTKIEEKAKD